jgi:hypothetical protein
MLCKRWGLPNKKIFWVRAVIHIAENPPETSGMEFVAEPWVGRSTIPQLFKQRGWGISNLC